MKYTVGWIRSQGLQARWTKTSNGAPIIVARERDGEVWAAVTGKMWEDADRDGMLTAYRNNTVLIEIFSIPL